MPPPERLTQQDDDAGQDGDERPSAQAGGQDEGLHVAGQDGLFAVAAAHADDQGLRAAHRRDPVVIDLDGQEVHVLGHSAEALAHDVDAGCAICVDAREEDRNRIYITLHLVI